jgi:uncharacterized membrane protein SirB2
MRGFMILGYEVNKKKQKKNWKINSELKDPMLVCTGRAYMDSKEWPPTDRTAKEKPQDAR